MGVRRALSTQLFRLAVSSSSESKNEIFISPSHSWRLFAVMSWRFFRTSGNNILAPLRSLLSATTDPDFIDAGEAILTSLVTEKLRWFTKDSKSDRNLDKPLSV